MDRKGRASLVPVLLFFLLVQAIAPGLALGQSPQFVPATGVVISELLPWARAGGWETEYVVLWNTGPSAVKVDGWKLCDDKGCAIFPKAGLEIGPDTSFVIAQNATSYFNMLRGRDPFADLAFEGLDGVMGTKRLAAGSSWPSMRNEGDFILLEDGNGKVLDAVAFGWPYQGEGWTGGPAPAPRMGWGMARERHHGLATGEFLDTNTSMDWPVSRTRRPESGEMGLYWVSGPNVRIVPLLFPKDGNVLAGILQNVSKHLVINTYEFTSLAMADLLGGLAKRGVMVKVLVEAHPVGGIDASELVVLDRLNASGCEVRLTDIKGGTDRPSQFGLDHAKYMILDSNITIVMSENLVPSALGTSKGGTANRGWGVAIWNNLLVQEMFDMFSRDFMWSYGLDLALPDRPRGGSGGDELPLVPVAPGKGTFRGNGTFYPLVSPYNAEDGLIDLMDGAKERIYAELLSCDLYWNLQRGVEEAQRSPLLDALVAAARRGVEVKVLLDGSFPDSSDNANVVAFLNEIANAEQLDIQARIADIPSITLVHNKGMVVDDLVVVSSINWVASAVRDNREVGLVIEASGVADLYVSYFLKDWQPASIPPDDGPGPRRYYAQNPTVAICGSLLAFGAIALAIFALMRRGRHEP